MAGEGSGLSTRRIEWWPRIQKNRFYGRGIMPLMGTRYAKSKQVHVASFVRKEPHFGLGPLKYDPELSWLFGVSDSASGLRSNAGGQIDMIELGCIVPNTDHELEIPIKRVRRYRQIWARYIRLPRYHQQVLMIWYTQRWINGRALVSEIEVAAAHQEWGRVGK
jgi:hypothetical protein